MGRINYTTGGWAADRHVDGSVVLDAVELAEEALLGLARLAAECGLALTVHDLGDRASATRARIARIGGGCVTLVDG